jgi:hypothetical protein
MAKTKSKEVLDWYGNPIPGVYRVRGKSGLTFRLEEDADGKKYWRAYTADGKPGDRLPAEGPDAPYLQVTNTKTGKVLYDSRCEPPSDAKMLPGYVGEKQRKRKLPG